VKKVFLVAVCLLTAWMTLSCGRDKGTGAGEAAASAIGPGEAARKFFEAVKSKGDALALIAAGTHMKECSPRMRDMYKLLKVDRTGAAKLLLLRAKTILSGYDVKTKTTTEAGKYAYVTFDMQPSEGSMRTAPAAGVLTLALEGGRWGVIWIEATNALRGNAPEPPAHWLGPKAK